MVKRLLQSSSEREALSQQIHELRRDRDTKKRNSDKVTAQLEEAKKDYGDLRKRFNPEPKPQPKPEPIQKSEPKPVIQETPKPVQQPAPKPAPRSFWERLFGRGGNSGNG